MRWQIILPIILATFFVSCSKSVAQNNPEYNLYTKNLQYSEKTIVDKILRESFKWRRTPYVLGGNSHIEGADCSAYTQQIYKNVFNIDIKRVTYLQKRYGKAVSKKDLKAGDLVFFNGKGPNNMHVGIYLGNDYFTHLSSSNGAKVRNIKSSYWAARYLGASRYYEFR